MIHQRTVIFEPVLTSVWERGQDKIGVSPY